MKSCFSRIFPLILALTPISVRAQDNGLLNKERTLWIDSGNAALMGKSSQRPNNTAILSYDFRTGDHHLFQEPQSASDVHFNTAGCASIGKIKLWGQFSYDNLSDSGTRFNTLVYDPFDERFIYNVADTTLSDRKRQSYDMEFKMAVPLAGRHFGGLHVRYRDRIAAKQQDPRSESTAYDVDLSPSFVFSIGSHHSLGMNILYSHYLERSAPTLSNSSLLQNVFVLKGLGNFTEDVVGSGGLYTMYYQGNSYGGAIQYGLDSGIELLVDAGCRLSRTELRQDATQPRDMGLSSVNDCFLDARLISERGNTLHKLSLNSLYKLTNGTEYATKQINGVGWEVVSKATMSKYRTLDAALSYDYYMTKDQSFLWNIHSRVRYISKNDSYVTPHSLFKYSGVSAEAGASRQFFFKRSNLTAGLQLKGYKGIDGEYVYNGARAESRPVKEWYPHDMEILSSDHVMVGADIEYLRVVKESTTIGLKTKFDYLHSHVGDRFLPSVELQLTF